jgi:hypothetical protein
MKRPGQKTVKVLAIILVMFSGCNSASKIQSEPSLQDTQTWMHSFVADRGSGATYEGKDCSGTITWPDKNGCTSFSFSFKDLDPNTAKSVQTVVSPPALMNMWRATAVTTSNLKKVVVYDSHTKGSTQDTVIEGISFLTSEDAERFAKALRHMIVVCGGKPSPF